jgi:ABC-type transport system involved in Fe-S cluster assembly fused permease/ATPase subunit
MLCYIDAPVLILGKLGFGYQSEKAIQKASNNLRHNRTSIVIAIVYPP